MDLTPEKAEIYEAAARAWVADSADAAYADWSQRDTWPASLQDNRNLRRIVDAIYPLIHRAGREDAAGEINKFGESARARAERYAPELDVCSRRSNDAVVDAYVKATSLARDGDVRNVHCSKCGDTRGGPVGHETDECSWKTVQYGETDQPRTV